MLVNNLEYDNFKNHEPSLYVPENRLGTLCKLGETTLFLFDLDDTLLDIENKSLTHRPDCFGVVGFACEVAGILGQKFDTPEWLLKDPISKQKVVKGKRSKQ